ncbi:MAG: hypothetical protein KBA81_03120 [Rhabdochlamydiaceae bacterium]|nr:hypothetical protein [Rhabdochlamydiaceae bacterium]
MKNAFMSLYSDYTDKLQYFIRSKIADVPDGFVDSCCKSFTVSFVVSAVFAKDHNLRAGFLGGTVSSLAIAVDALIRKLVIFISTISTDEEVSDPTQAVICADIAKVSFGLTLYLARILKLQVNTKGTCMTTLPLYLYSASRMSHSPLFGIVIRG